MYMSPLSLCEEEEVEEEEEEEEFDDSEADPDDEDEEEEEEDDDEDDDSERLDDDEDSSSSLESLVCLSRFLCRPSPVAPTGAGASGNLEAIFIRVSMKGLYLNHFHAGG